MCTALYPRTVCLSVVPSRIVLGNEAVFSGDEVLESKECSMPRRGTEFGDQQAVV